MMTMTSSFWKRLLVLAGASILTLGRLWHSASSLILPHQPAESAAASSDSTSTGLFKGNHHNHSSRLQPCNPAQVHHAALDSASLEHFVLLSYTVSSGVPGYEDLPEGSRAKMLLAQGSCDDGSTDDSSTDDSSGDGGAGDDTDDSDSDSYDAADYDDTGDSSDDA